MHPSRFLTKPLRFLFLSTLTPLCSLSHARKEQDARGRKSRSGHGSAGRQHARGRATSSGEPILHLRAPDGGGGAAQGAPGPG
jgi:hypothetical protein